MTKEKLEGIIKNEIGNLNPIPDDRLSGHTTAEYACMDYPGYPATYEECYNLHYMEFAAVIVIGAATCYILFAKMLSK